MASTATISSRNHTAGAKLPDWISGWSQDEFGISVAFSLPTGEKYWEYVDQRLRWIPAGTFLMGSPESETGRWENEGPQHEVIISRGFWMFDTPVTQRLWEHVMGDKPRHFKDSDRPVEGVEWRRCTEFCERLSSAVGATFQLPTEAQWEYACRAGTNTATYAGEIEILGENYAPILDEIAWYGGNSAVDFDLKEGSDSSSWPEKQFEHKQAGTRKVAQKRANPWGLYDMLGNVWEWCLDGSRTYAQEVVSDPTGPREPGASRVVRGGGWFSGAHRVRAACRDASAPAVRNLYLGFRCVCSSAE